MSEKAKRNSASDDGAGKQLSLPIPDEVRVIASSSESVVEIEKELKLDATGEVTVETITEVKTEIAIVQSGCSQSKSGAVNSEATSGCDDIQKRSVTQSKVEKTIASSAMSEQTSEKYDAKHLVLQHEKREVTTMVAVVEENIVDKGRDFETTLSELERIVVQLEGEVKLEDALQLFDRGVRLSQDCEEFLKSAEQKIEILKKAVNGSLSTEKFNEDAYSS